MSRTEELAAAFDAGDDLSSFETLIEAIAIRAGLEIHRDRAMTLACAFADLKMLEAHGAPHQKAVAAVMRHYGLTRKTVENNVCGLNVAAQTKSRGGNLWDSRKENPVQLIERLALFFRE